MKLKRKTTIISLALVLVLGAFGLQQAIAITPGLYEVEGNPSCATLYNATVISGPAIDILDLGPLFGFKYDNNPTSGVSSTLTNNAPWVVTNGPQDPNNSVSIFNVVLNGSEGIQFDWSATLGIDAVIVKAQDANAYVYSPEAFGASGLIAPDGKAISHVEFCYDYDLTVSKDAHTSYTRTHDWDITKTPSDDYVGFVGDSFTHEYTITVDRIGYTDSDWKVEGTITIENNTPFDATIESVNDVVSDGLTANVDCGVTFPYTLVAGDTLACSYDRMLDDGTTRLNTATVTTSGAVGGNTATAYVDFGSTLPTEVNTSVNVTDDNGTPADTSDDKPFGPLSDGQSATYSRDFVCPTTGYSAAGVYTAPTLKNTAEIDETGDSDFAEVNLTCYLWEVSKTADGTYQDQYEWEITKTVAPPNQSGFAGDTLGWEWTITWSSSWVKEINHLVEGVITVNNPADIELTVDVSDELTGGFGASVDCDGAGGTSLTIAANSSGTCDYTAEPDSQLAQNTATATRNGVSVSNSVDVEWVKGEDVGLDATISDNNHTLIPVGSAQPFTYPGSHICSSDAGDYDANGTYTGEAENTATITWTGDSDSSTANTSYDCYLWDVSKTADGSYNDRYDWTILKEVSPESQSGFAGDTLDWTWSITWESFWVEEINHAVSGLITVGNPSDLELTVDVTDALTGGVGATVTCNDGDGGTSLTIAANSSGTCNYTAAPGSRLADNTATATRNAVSVWDTVPVTWVAGPDAGMDAVISDDTHVDIPVGPGSYSYGSSHTCSTDSGAYTDGSYSGGASNTATITWTGGSDSSTDNTSYDCFIPSIEKTANPSYTRTWTWTIDKSADQTSLLLEYTDPPVSVNYAVKVTASSVDSDWAVAGSITINNPNPEDDLVVPLSDVLNDGTVASITGCTGTGVTFVAGVLTVPAGGGTAVCDYNAAPVDVTATLNTATIILNGISFSGDRSVDFAGPTTEIDECVDVGDTNTDPLGTVCADQAPATFNYTLTFGQDPSADIWVDCAETQHPNIATFITNDTPITGWAEWVIDITMICDPGCTLTQGYWKTHSEQGPAPYDETWADLPNGADTLFFDTGKSWFTIFHMPPKGGNAYIILAYQYMAATLNKLSGAMMPADVTTILGQAGALLDLKDYDVLIEIPKDDPNRAIAIELAGTLDDYNNGVIGPGHCDSEEDLTSYAIGGFLSEVPLP